MSEYFDDTPYWRLLENDNILGIFWYAMKSKKYNLAYNAFLIDPRKCMACHEDIVLKLGEFHDIYSVLYNFGITPRNPEILLEMMRRHPITDYVIEWYWAQLGDICYLEQIVELYQYPSFHACHRYIRNISPEQVRVFLDHGVYFIVDRAQAMPYWYHSMMSDYIHQNLAGYFEIITQPTPQNIVSRTADYEEVTHQKIIEVNAKYPIQASSLIRYHLREPYIPISLVTELCNCKIISFIGTYMYLDDTLGNIEYLLREGFQVLALPKDIANKRKALQLTELYEKYGWMCTGKRTKGAHTRTILPVNHA